MGYVSYLQHTPHCALFMSAVRLLEGVTLTLKPCKGHAQRYFAVSVVHRDRLYDFPIIERAVIGHNANSVYATPIRHRSSQFPG